MANTLKDLASTVQVVSQEALERAFVELKTYIDAHAGSEAVQQLQTQLDTLIGAEGDADKLLNTFNDIKAFLADYSEDDTLASLISAINTAVSNEATRATAAETALSGRITTLENISVMTSAQAKTLFNSVFNPTPEPEQQGGE